MHLKKTVCCCYKFLIAAGGGNQFQICITSLTEWRLFLPLQCSYLYIYTLGCFTHRVPEFILHKAAGSQNRMRLLLFPKKKKKKQMPKKKQMKGTIQGAKCEMSSKNQTQAQLEVITLQGCRKKGDGNKNPPPPRQCLRKCWLQQRVGDKTYRKHQELLLFL